MPSNQIQAVFARYLNNEIVSLEEKYSFLSKLVDELLPVLPKTETILDSLKEGITKAYKDAALTPDPSIYTLRKNTSCRVCGNEDLAGSSWDLDSDVVSQIVSCNSCGSEWTDEYLHTESIGLRFGEYLPITFTSTWEEGGLDTKGKLCLEDFSFETDAVDTNYEFHLCDSITVDLAELDMSFSIELIDQAIPDHILEGLTELFDESMLFNNVIQKLPKFLSLEGVTHHSYS